MRRAWTSSLAADLLLISTFSLMAPAASAVWAGSGLLADKMQVKLVEQSHRAYFLKRVSFAKTADMLAAGSAVVVDARFAADYGNGHIPGAINLPVTASAETLRLSMSGVRSDLPVIVYCQSKSCPFAKTVAADLIQAGFTSVELLDGGWEEWCQWRH
jgi:rhodanese-related sulfurtransferase